MTMLKSQSYTTLARNVLFGILFLPAAMYFYIICQQHYVLFHTLAEFFSVFIAFGIFVFFWNSRQWLTNSFYVILGVAFFFIGSFDLLHTLAYNGMLFSQLDALNISVKLWMVARIIESASYLTAFFLLRQSFKLSGIVCIYLLFSAELLISILARHWFPDCYVPGIGLTPFKIALEYAVMLILGTSIWQLHAQRKVFGPDIYKLLLGALITTILSEFCATLFISMTDFHHFLGHIFKIISYYLIYRVVIVAGILKPQETLYLELSEKEKEFRSFFELSSIGKAEIDLKTGLFKKVNQKLCTLTGFDEKALTQMPFFQLIYDNSLNTLKAIFNDLKTGEIENWEIKCRLISKHDAIIWVLMSGTALKDRDQKPQYALVDILDITAEHDYALALQENEELFRMAVENYPSMFIIYDQDRKILFINKKSQHIMHWTSDTIVGQLDEHVLNRNIIDQFLPTLINAYTTKTIQRIEIQGLLNNNNSRFIVSYIPILDTNGNIRRMLGIFHDITERHQLEMERIMQADMLLSQQEYVLKKTQSELISAKRLSDIGTLSAMVAHELRNPLSVIRMAAYNIRRKNSNTNLVKHLDSVDKKVIESDQIINNLLNYARIKKPGFGMFLIDKLIQECADSCANQAGKNKVTIRINTQQTKSLKIEGDPQQIAEIINNIVLNAYQAIGEESGEISILCEFLHTDKLAITIANTGPSIENDDLDQIFNPFFTRKSKGTGLGLSICQELIVMHKGHIYVENLPETGVQFIITLPIKQNL